MRNVIINADDFGLCRGVNYGILDSHKFGIVNSTTMLVNMPGTEHAVELARLYPKLRVGIHLTLTCGRPVSGEVSSLVDERGFFRYTSRVFEEKEIDVDEVEVEWTSQIDRFLSFGLPLSHIDSHHHVHSFQPLIPVVKRLSERYAVPVRNAFGNDVEGKNLLTDRFSMEFYGEGVSVEGFKRILDSGNQTLEIMCHPAYVDSFLKENSSYCEQRLRELDVLTSDDLL
ncbi:chitin disaccharide deacetylase [Rossellomorea vietnamensis]|uniref:Chitin disaccharide deacetylase n=1 Tax=Rossellomorea vietnamensis TaxID=218284 RepID=A0ACD4C444_9BACI|nr:chitin disaccharide deacetylase [Rossellomorea vietnamensis]UXH43383.1 chitin disaccharide deacetylase [Rossellomorea vietnamensis]